MRWWKVCCSASFTIFRRMRLINAIIFGKLLRKTIQSAFASILNWHIGSTWTSIVLTMESRRFQIAGKLDSINLFDKFLPIAIIWRNGALRWTRLVVWVKWLKIFLDYRRIPPLQIKCSHLWSDHVGCHTQLCAFNPGLLCSQKFLGISKGQGNKLKDLFITIKYFRLMKANCPWNAQSVKLLKK